MLYRITDAVYPILIYYLIGAVLNTVLGTVLSDALVTAMAALAMMPVVIWLYRKDKQLGRAAVEKKKRKVWTYMLIAAAGILISQAFTWLMNAVGVTEVFSNKQQESLLSGEFAVQLIGFGLITPVTEEILFRGLLYGRIKSFLSGGWAMLFAAVLFALYHGNMVQIIYAFPMGLILIWLYEKWGDIKAPIVFHMAANLVSVLINQFL